MASQVQKRVNRILPVIGSAKQQGRLINSPLKAEEYALAVRMGMESLSPELFLSGITHYSAEPKNRRFLKLAAIGSSSLNMFVSEYFYYKFPKLPVAPLVHFTKKYVQPAVVYDVAKSYGLHDVAQIDPVRNLI